MKVVRIRSRKTDYQPDPRHSLALHPENLEGADIMTVSERLHRGVLIEALEDLRNGEVSEERRKATWEWLLDPLFRGDEPPAFTMRACCLVVGKECFSFLNSLIWKRRKEVDRLFGKGAAAKLMAKAFDRIPLNENELAIECGGRA